MVDKVSNTIKNLDEGLNLVVLIISVAFLGLLHDALEFEDGLSLLLQLRVDDVLHAERVVLLSLYQLCLVIGLVVKLNPVKSVKKVF